MFLKEEEISARIILVQGRSCLRQERSSIALFDFFPLFESKDELFNQSAESLGVNLSIAFVPATIPFIPKYIEKNL